MESYTLYHYETCPFCLRVRGFLQAVGLDVPLRDIHKDPQAYRDLVTGGGRQTVPCLQIDDDAGTTWLYESRDIIQYLTSRTGEAPG